MDRTASREVLRPNEHRPQVSPPLEPIESTTAAGALDAGAAEGSRGRGRVLSRLEPGDALALLRRGLVPVDPSIPFGVSWWRAGANGRGVYPCDESAEGDPHARVTLADLGGEVRAERRETRPKGTGRALCGATFAEREGEGFHRTQDALRSLGVVQLDVDPPKGEGADLAAPAFGTILDRAACVGAAIVAHPSPSETREGRRARRVRVWIRVATRGGVEVLRGAADDPGDLTDAVACVVSLLGSQCGASPDLAAAGPQALGYTSATHAAALGGVEVLPFPFALDPFEVRAAAIAAGAWEPRSRRSSRGTLARDRGALDVFLARAEALCPGIIGRGSHAVTYLRCPRWIEHTDGRGRGEDSSCGVNTTSGWVGCSHSHGGAGPLHHRAFIAAIVDAVAAEHPDRRAELESLAAGVFAPAAAAVLGEVFEGDAPDDDPRVTWHLDGEGRAVPMLPSAEASGAAVVDAFRAASHAWDAGSRAVTLLRVLTGGLKSTSFRVAFAALLPDLPGDLDARPDSPRPCGVVVTETRGVARETAAGIDAAGRGEHLGESAPEHLAELVPLRRGRAGEVLRAAPYVPLSLLGADGIEVDPAAPGAEYAERACVFANGPNGGRAGELERAGCSARASLCRNAGTDVPAELGKPGVRGPCPRAETCIGTREFFYLDGTSPQPGEPWVAVATVDAAGVIPPALQGAMHLIDEGEKLTTTKPAVVSGALAAVGGGAEALAAVLPGDHLAPDAPRDAPRPRAAVRAVFGGLVSIVRALASGSEGELLAFLSTPPAEREAAALDRLARWAALGVGDHTRTAREAWPTLGGGLAEAWERWRRASPVVAKHGSRHARRAGGELWRALQSWAYGADVEPQVLIDRGANGESYTETPTGAAVVHALSPAAIAALGWIERGPVMVADATLDPSLLASALLAGEPASPVSRIEVRAWDLPDRAEVRRVFARTDATSRTRLTARGGRVRWRDSKGAAAAAAVTGGLAEVLRAAPRTDGTTRGDSPLAPVVAFAPRPLALALRALAEGWEPDSIRTGARAEVPAGIRDGVALSVETAPAEVRAAVAELERRAERVWWEWHGGKLARGSNEPHGAGARCVVMFGDGLIPVAEGERTAGRARRTGEGAGSRALRRAAAVALAQAFGRVRVRVIEGPVLLIHLGTVRPLDWHPERIESTTLERLSRPPAAAPPVRALEPAPAPAEVREVRPDLPAELAAALATGWTVGAIAAACDVDARTVRRWVAGATPRAGALDPLAAALADTAEPVRGAYRAMVSGRFAGRRIEDLREGTRALHGIIPASLALAGDAARRGIELPEGVRPLTVRDLPPGALERWTAGRIELPADVVATLAELAPAMARGWCGGRDAEVPALSDRVTPRPRRFGAIPQELAAPIAAALERLDAARSFPDDPPDGGGEGAELWERDREHLDGEGPDDAAGEGVLVA